jgi:hypothetical protein
MNRLRAISRARAIRFNLHRRHIRDQGSGSVSPRLGAPSASGSRLSRREIMRALAGALAGLLVIALVWIMTARTAQQSLPPVSEITRPAPDFALPGLNGTTVRLSDYRGKVVLVNFWGTWCEPCKEETPALAPVYRKLHDQGLVISAWICATRSAQGPMVTPMCGPSLAAMAGSTRLRSIRPGRRRGRSRSIQSRPAISWMRRA